MPEHVSEIDLERARRQGADVKKVPTMVTVPELAGMLEQYQATMRQKMERWEKNHAEKMAKFDELIASINAAAGKGSAAVDLGPIMAMVREIQRDHKKIAAEHAQLMAGGGDEREACAYKLTGRRDQRGLIDLEHGLTFTPVD